MNTLLKRTQIQFHDGREEAIDTKRRQDFDRKVFFERFFPNKQIDPTSIYDRFGDWMLDYTNVHAEKKKEGLLDINEDSVRIFTLWAENIDTGDILCTLRGFIHLGSFGFDSSWYDDILIRDWEYSDSDLSEYRYPWAIVSSFRTILKEEQDLHIIIQKVKIEINQYWKKIRKRTINRFEKGTPRWKYYVLSHDEVIHYTIVCPSIDREVIEVLLDTDFSIADFMQILVSKTPAYDEATIRHHLNTAKKILDEN